MKQNRRMQYLAAFAVSLATMTNGMALFWSAPILPKFHNNEIIANITSSEISWVVTAIIPGNILGALIASRISDNFGRRATILSSALPFIIGTVLVLCATKAWMLYIARIMWGTACGMINTVSGIYLSEISDKEIRGILTATTRFMFSFGSFVTLVIGSFLSYQSLSSLLIVFPACYLSVCWWIPESPYYLVKEGKIEAAKKALVGLSSSRDEKVIEEKLSLMQSDVRKEMTRSGSVKELFSGKQYRRAVIVTAGLRATQLLTGMIPIQQYLGQIIQLSNSGMKLSTAFVVFGAIRFVASFISPLIVDKIGRRPLLICTYILASMILAIVGTYFFIQQVIGIDNETINLFRYTVFLGIIIVNIVANFGFDTLVFIIPSEIFPLNVKSIAMTLFNLYSAFFTFISIRGYQVMEDIIGLQGVFWFYAAMAITGAVFTYVIVPETKGKSLRDIQIQLQGNIYDESDETDEKLNKMAPINVDIENSTELKDMSDKIGSNKKSEENKLLQNK